jgi:hypothetical protein
MRPTGCGGVQTRLFLADRNALLYGVTSTNHQRFFRLVVQLAALREAVQSGDAQSVEQVEVAHAFKGSCLYMGAVRMASACAELQKAGAHGDLARPPSSSTC